MADEPSAEDLIGMAQHPLHAVWIAGVDAATSADFRDARGRLDEAAYVRYGLNVMRQVHANVVAAAESRGRAAGYAEAVQALRDQADSWFDGTPQRTFWLNAAAYLDNRAAALAAAPSATTEEPTP